MLCFTGFFGGILISRRKVVKPGEDLLGKDPPACYSQQDLYIGNTVCLESFNMTITDADEYALRYMELHSCEVIIVVDITNIIHVLSF